MKKIMILGGSILQLPIIRKAKKMKLYTIVLDYDANAIGLNEADKAYIISTTDIKSAIEIAKKEKLDSIVTMATDMPMRTVAAVGNKFNLNTISFDTALKATDKLLMRKQLALHNIPIPLFYEVKNLIDFNKAIKNFKDKFIVKPSDGSGSKGVVLCDHNQQKDLTSIFYEVMSYSSSGYILLEEFMNGPEVSVESLTINGKSHVIAITDKRKTALPYFVETGHSIPSTLDNEVQREIKEVTIAAIESLGINTGPTHTELIITDEGPKIVEIGARLGGDNITSHLVPLATGIDMVEATIKLSLGESIDFKKGNNFGAAIRYFHGKDGKLKSVGNVKKLRDKPGVKEIIVTKKIGESIQEIHSSSDRLGYVIAQDENVNRAIAICEDAINQLEITID